MDQRCHTSANPYGLPLAALLALALLACVAFARPAASRADERVPVTTARANLLENPGGAVGAVSDQGWDSVTIPGWRVEGGLPSVVRYGTRGFDTSPDPAGAPARLFAGGAGGTAQLLQTVRLRAPGGELLATGSRYTIAGVFGGTDTSAASLTLTLLSRSGAVLARREIAGPASGALAASSATGPLPPGTASAEVELVLATSLHDFDGPDAPIVGYDRAVAGDLSFSVSAPVRSPSPLVPPVARIPRYDHVFLFYFENQDYRSVIGNTQAAPYLNALRADGSTLASMFGEEHPSDGNYLALAGGSAFGIPLNDPLEEDPLDTIRAPQIGDLLDTAHETWRDYLQSADGPCDDTVHGYYWDDDLPTLYFGDVRGRPAYCSAHVLPLDALQTDLASTATTPNFAWIGPDDCSDMEGCGIAAGDRFLAHELGLILNSPAWRTERSLAIITFDEDGYDFERPAQRVPTVMLASSGLRAGYTSTVRYTHYSLLRTIEAALGLGSLTPNDLWAQPTNDVFDALAADPPGAAIARASASAARLGDAADARRSAGARRDSPAYAVAASPDRDPTAFVVSSAGNAVTPIDLRTRRPGPAIPVGLDPQAIAVTPDGATAFVVNNGSNSVTPIDTATRAALAPIPVGKDPSGIAITPDGRTAFVSDSGSDTVTPIDAATDTPLPAIAVGTGPRAIAVSPDGQTAYVLDWGGGSVTPIDPRTDVPGTPIQVGGYPVAIAFTPDGATAYVASFGSDTVTPIRVASGQEGPAIPAGAAPDALAVTQDGHTLEVVDGDGERVTPIDTATNLPGAPVSAGYSPEAVAISPTGVAYVVNTISGTLTPIATATGTAGRPISVGAFSYPTTIALTPDGRTAVVVDTYAGRVSLLNTRTGGVSAPKGVGEYPVAVAIGN